MSFSKTVSVFAALASIFAAGATGYKLAQESQPQDNLDLQQKIVDLENQIEESKQKQPVVQQTTPPPVVLPETQTTPQLPPSPQPPVPPKLLNDF